MPDNGAESNQFCQSLLWLSQGSNPPTEDCSLMENKIYVLHSKTYLPTTLKLKYVIKHVVYSTLKSKLTVFHHHHLVFLWHSLPFTNSLPVELIRVDIWWWNKVFYFLFPSQVGFSTFYIGLFFTCTVVLVNILEYFIYVWVTTSQLQKGGGEGKCPSRDYLKLRFHLYVMTNTNDECECDKIIRKHRISIGVLPFVWMQGTTTTKWIPSCSDWSECEWFVRREIPSYTGLPRLTQGETTLVPYYHWSFAFVIIFTSRINGIVALG